MTRSRVIFRQEAEGDQTVRGGSKKAVQQGRSHFCARSVLEYVSTEKWRERCWQLFSTAPHFTCSLSTLYMNLYEGKHMEMYQKKHSI